MAQGREGEGGLKPERCGKNKVTPQAQAAAAAWAGGGLQPRATTPAGPAGLGIAADDDVLRLEEEEEEAQRTLFTSSTVLPVLSPPFPSRPTVVRDLVGSRA